MVGAGFSKNAEAGEEVQIKDWNALCEDFYTALFDEKPSVEKFKLKSALRFAQQVQSSQGRAALDEIIKKAVPNESISPGFLHKKLVSLKWRDIFTTNYDTLLEDAAKTVFRNYHTVTSKNSLIYQPHPRIVKLHGSFPDNRPFIITEEDYRTYPALFPEFVNTIRQALIETQLCLIGFSGDDPNFLNWLGWVRDVLGPQMHPIYMVNVDSERPHDAEIKLLADRKIEVIYAPDISDSVTEAFDFIFSFLDVDNESEWNGKIDATWYKTDDLRSYLQKMQAVKKTYPGWLILPLDKLKDFDDCTALLPFIGNSFEGFNDDEKLEFLYQFVWRLQISFTPAWLEQNWLEAAISKILANYQQMTLQQKEKACYLAVFLLQIYRITGHGDFDRILRFCRINIPPYSSKLLKRVRYEECIWNLTHCNFNILDSLLEDWKISPSDYQGALWKSKILREIDRNEEANSVLQGAIDDVRYKLLNDNDSDYLNSANAVLTCCRFGSLHKEVKKARNDHKFILLEYFRELEREMNVPDPTYSTTTHGFNIGTSTTTWHLSHKGYFHRYIGSGRFYLLAEIYGYPIGSREISYDKRLNGISLPILAELDFGVAVNYLMEINNEEVTDKALSRRALFHLGFEEPSRLFDEWIEKINPKGISKMNFRRKNREFNTMLRVFARGSVWLDDEKTLQLIHILWDIDDFSYSKRDSYLRTCYNSLSAIKREEVWWEIMNSPIKLSSNFSDLIKPQIAINSWKGDDNTIEAIITGLESPHRDLRHVAMNRFCEVQSLMPDDLREEVDAVITERFGNIIDNDFSDYLGHCLKRVPNRRWEPLLRDYFTKKFADALTKDYTFVNSSAPISDFESFIISCINCRSCLSSLQTEQVLSKIIDFFELNRKEMMKQREPSPFLGGMRDFFGNAVVHIVDFIAATDVSVMPEDLLKRLLRLLVEIGDTYPTLVAVANIFLQQGSKIDIGKAELSRQLIKEWMKKGVVSQKQERMRDAFRAVIKSHKLTNGVLGLNDVVKPAIELLKLVINETTKNIIIHLFNVLNYPILGKRKTKLLVDIMAELPERILIDNGISAELKADLLYYGLRLARKLEPLHSDEVDVSRCAAAWHEILNSPTIANDIKRGYELQ